MMSTESLISLYAYGPALKAYGLLSSDDSSVRTIFPAGDRGTLDDKDIRMVTTPTRLMAFVELGPLRRTIDLRHSGCVDYQVPLTPCVQRGVN